MAAIDVGPGAIDRVTVLGSNGYTILDLGNPANGSGALTSFELWLNTENGVGVKVGTFSGSGTDWVSRDVASIGAVPAGTKQTFSGLSISVEPSDVIGAYGTVLKIERDISGSGACFLSGDQFGAGEGTYSIIDGSVSIYATGSTRIPRHSFINFQNPGVF